MAEERTGPHAGEHWRAVWNAYVEHFNKYRAENPDWQAFFSAHHMYALDEALREFDKARSSAVLTEEDVDAELMELADKLDSEAAISARPGQLDRLEQIASELRRIARTPWVEER